MAREQMGERPLLLVGWDGVDGELVRNLIQSGRLPNLGALLDRGVWRTIAGLPGLGDDPHWSTFSTGVNPGVHGRFMYASQDPASSRISMHKRHEAAPAEPFWASLARRGLQCVVLDVPKSPLARIQGVLEVHDWMPHGADGGQPVAWPASFADRFSDRPQDDFTDCYRVWSSEEELRQHSSLLSLRRAHRTRTVCELVESTAADFWLVVYAEGHCAGHHFYHLHNPRSADEQALGTSLGDLLVQQLIAMDADLGALASAFDHACDIAVFSPLGMVHADSADHAVRHVLAGLEKTWQETSARTTRVRAAAARRGFKHGSRLARKLSRPVRDLAGVAFYPVRTNAVDTPIRLSIHGRDPWGLIKPSECDAVIDWISERLLELVDENGDAVVEEVIRTSSRYPGPFSEVHADLLALVARRRPRSVQSPVLGSLEMLTDTPARPGDHRPGGWIVADRSWDVGEGTIQIADVSRHVSDRAAENRRDLR